MLTGFMNMIDIEFLAFQESFLYYSKDISDLIECNPKLTFVFSHGLSNARGVGIACIRDAFDKIQEIELEYNPEIDGEDALIWETGRVCGVKLVKKDETLIIISVYAPNKASDRCIFLRRLGWLCSQLEDKFLLLGDWNTVLDQKDRWPMRFAQEDTPFQLKNLLSSLDLYDIWRENNQNSLQYTYSRPFIALDSPVELSRLDMIFFPRHIASRLEKIEITASLGSDHINCSKICLNIVKKIRQGKRRWQLDSLIIFQDKFQKSILKLISKVKASNEQGWNKWIIFKEKAKKIAQKVSFKRASQKKKQLLRQEAKAELQKMRDAKDPAGVSKAASYRKKCQLSNIFLRKHIDNMLKSKAAWYLLYEDRCSKHFFRPFKFHKKENIAKLKESSESLATDNLDRMVEIAKDHYSKLYESEAVNTMAQTALLAACPSLERDNSIDNAELPINAQEIEDVIKGTKGNTAPGPDGISWAFYKAFREELTQLLLDAYLDLVSYKTFPIDFAAGEIILIYKKGDTEDIANYRPITLLNVDYKILMKILMRRMLPNVEKFVAP